MSYRGAVSSVALLLLFAASGRAADEKPCIYNSEMFENQSFRLNGTVCQQCSEGKWVDRADHERATLCQRAKEKRLVTQLPVPNKDTHCYDGAWFSDGAYFISSNDGRCKQCNLTDIAEKPEVYCRPVTPPPPPATPTPTPRPPR